ncbi:PucR family transcriptional regulator [Nocardia terpenica]|uniref:PucR family transcriptional regulator n=1 Tax=Nocardia terpenica TaxID=455432 RepID=A0A6G9YY91_9NOCA|nr:PucR family transcriptional regulator [Nocardia terpenica]QIS18140.1 PucR family transcriptional regulator [Nocardia terpenica]
MSVPVSWVLSQPDLAIRLVGGGSGVARTVDLVLTTELDNPYRWLSGGELVLTTGMRLPASSAERRAFLRGFDECGVAAVGFGTGLSHPEIPPELVATADEIGIPLFEVPLPTPFAAIVKRVTARVAELQYDALLRASRAQPRMTRALVRSGAQAIVRELATSLGATVLVLDPAGQLTDAHPAVPGEDLLRTVRAALAADPEVASGVRTDPSGRSLTHQRISVGARTYGDLVVVGPAPLGHVDQILLGHANSLLALDFEKPERLRAAQHRLNSTALALLLGAETDPAPAWAQLAQITDARGRIGVLAAECDSAEAAAAVRAAIDDATLRAGYPLFLHTDHDRVLVVLPGCEAADFARRLTVDPGVRRSIRLGLSESHALSELAEAARSAGLAASAAERGGVAVEFGDLAGRSLLSFDETRRVLDTMAHTLLTPLAEHDRGNGTELTAALRAFLEANGQWESAAIALGVHRHTLRKRVAAAQDLLGVDLDSARVRAELLLALLARDS